jgi:DNA mismatch endonuclease (patch repair protein)
MTDIYSKETRSRVMSAVRGKDTQPERKVRSFLHKAGYRFRLHYKILPGKPDIVFPRFNTVIFVNGCFWHQHAGCKKATIPHNNKLFWKRKLSRTVQRDSENIQKLENMGWKVIIIWECELLGSFDKTMLRTLRSLLIRTSFLTLGV